MVKWLKINFIPKGLSRYYLLSLLKDKTMDLDEIVEKIIKDGEGSWKPSTTFINNLLKSLTKEGLIEEVEGKYKITEKGMELLNNIHYLEVTIKKQIQLLLKIGNVGKFVVSDLLDRLISTSTLLSENLKKMIKEEVKKHKEFLLRELKKEDKEVRERVRVE